MNKRLKALLLGSSLLLAGCNKKEDYLVALDALPLYLECSSLEDLYSYINGVNYDEKFGPFTIYLPSNLESFDIVSIYVFSVTSGPKYFANPYLPPIVAAYVEYQVIDENISFISTEFYAIQGEVAGSINIVSETPNVENYPRVLQMKNDYYANTPSEHRASLYKNTKEVGNAHILYKDNAPDEIKSGLNQQISNNLANSLVPYKI